MMVLLLLQLQRRHHPVKEQIKNKLIFLRFVQVTGSLWLHSVPFIKVPYFSARLLSPLRITQIGIAVSIENKVN